jgi:hypothetical protein
MGVETEDERVRVFPKGSRDFADANMDFSKRYPRDLLAEFLGYVINHCRISENVCQ